jgi:beta-mannanase
MNGNWYVWDGYHNGQSSGPAKYIAAWKHIHNIFNSASATNVKWVWSPNHTSTPDESWNQAVNYYPGDDYVDWIGIDGYNWGQGSWQTFAQIFSSAYATFESYGKPLMISEFACATDESYRKADWITDAFSKIENTYSKIRIFVWFNQNKERDWRISSSSSASNAFKNAVSDTYFLESKPTE